MASITIRAGKGSPLTNAEVDANFTNLNTAVIDAATTAAWATITGKPTTLSGYGITDAQTALVSGTSIKTVNGQSVLGSGNIQIDGGVTSFNTRTGAVSLSSGDVTGALGFTPYNSTNPSGYIASSGSYADPSWITSLASSKLTGTIDNARLNGGTYTINVTGNAGTATALQTARTINGIPFNGSAAIDTTEWFHSDRDFPNGTLITTSINYAVSEGDPFVLEIRGNSYGGIVPLDLLYQGYIYSGTIINHGGISNGLNISGLVAINNGGNLCFWFPSQGYWNGYNVKVYTAYATRATNRVTSITGVAKPTTAKEVALSANIRQSLHSGNFTSYAPGLTGSGASGTWGISISGSAGSISGFNNPTTAATANTIAYRDGAGDITVRELALTVGVQEFTPSSLVAIYPTTNQAVKVTAGGARSFLDVPTRAGLNASGTWGISVTGTANGLSSSNYINRTGSSGNLNTDFQNTPAGTQRYQGDDSSLGNGPGGTWWIYEHKRHSNGSNFWGTQVAWGWEDNANRLATRNVSANNFGGWVYYLNSVNYNNYSPTLTGGNASGTWGISVTGNASTAGNLPTLYAGGQQTNPQVYFNENIGLRVAMTGVPSVWSDTLWINGYAGADVPNMCALHTIRNGTPRMWISSQSNRATSYGTMYEFLSAYNYNNYSPTLTGGNASGTWGISVTGSANSLNLSGHTISNNSWAGGGGYHGYQFNGGNYRFGFSSTGGVVDVYADGNFYATDSSHLVLHAGNYTSYSPPYSGGTMTGLWYFQSNRNTTSDSPPLQAYSNNGSGAIMSFHRGGYYAVNFGLDSDNVMRIGGWSAAANRWQLDMSGNGTYAGNITAYSDERLKTNWRDLPENFVARLAQVKVGIYDRLDEEDVTQVGVSAQSFQQLLPQAIMTAKDEMGTLSVSYGNAALASAVELAKDNVELRARIEKLEALVSKLIER